MSTRLNRKRTVTLQDLIKQLKFYEELDKKQALKNTLERAKRRARSYENFTADDIVNLAHEEYIDKTVNTLRTKLENIFVQSSKVELTELIEIGMDKISAYIALLFLSAESDIELVQEEFYGDLFIQKSSNVENSVNTEIEQSNTNNKNKSSDKTTYNDKIQEEKIKIGGMYSNIINAPPDKEVVIAS